MASTSSSSPPDSVPETHTKRARIDDGSRHSSWRDWASLSCGPATVIADRLLSADVTDYIRFRGVCGAWRRCTADPYADVLDRRFHPHGWTMFYDDYTRRRGGGCRFRFVNSSTGRSIRKAGRGLDDGRTLVARTSAGLLVLLNTTTDAASVLNPITGARADLPPLTTFLPGSGHPRDLDLPRWPDGAHFSAELADGSVPLVVISFGGHRRLGVARPGDERWAIVEGRCRIHGLFSSAGRVYCCSGKTVMVLETSPDQPPRLVKAYT